MRDILFELLLRRRILHFRPLEIAKLRNSCFSIYPRLLLFNEYFEIFYAHAITDRIWLLLQTLKPPIVSQCVISRIWGVLECRVKGTAGKRNFKSQTWSAIIITIKYNTDTFSLLESMLR